MFQSIAVIIPLILKLSVGAPASWFLCPFSFFFFFNFWLRWVCCCVRAFSTCSRWGLLSSCGTWASHHGGFSYCRTQVLGAWASVVAAHELSSCGSQALQHSGFSSCGAQAQKFFHDMCSLPWPGIESMSPEFAGGFLSTVPPGKVPCVLLTWT